MSAFGDTFVEAADTTLASHTPTGPDAGSGWTLGSGLIQVLGASDLAEDNNTGTGNRYGMNDSLDTDQMDVSGDISFNGALIVGDLIASGVSGRLSTANSTAAIYEFEFNWGAGVNGSYQLDSASLDEAWPGGSVTFLLQNRTSDQRGYANGVLKLTLTNNLGAGNKFAGIAITNFQGDATKHGRVDNFRTVAMVTGVGVSVGGMTSMHPGASPGLVPASWRFMASNWWPYSPPVVSTFDESLMAAMNWPWPDRMIVPPQVVASGMTPPNNIPS